MIEETLKAFITDRAASSGVVVSEVAQVEYGWRADCRLGTLRHKHVHFSVVEAKDSVLQVFKKKRASLERQLAELDERERKALEDVDRLASKVVGKDTPHAQD